MWLTSLTATPGFAVVTAWKPQTMSNTARLSALGLFLTSLAFRKNNATFSTLTGLENVSRNVSLLAVCGVISYGYVNVKAGA